MLSACRGWGPCIILPALLSLTRSALSCTNTHRRECYSCLTQSLHYVLGSVLQTSSKKKPLNKIQSALPKGHPLFLCCSQGGSAGAAVCCSQSSLCQTGDGESFPSQGSDSRGTATVSLSAGQEHPRGCSSWMLPRVLDAEPVWSLHPSPQVGHAQLLTFCSQMFSARELKSCSDSPQGPLHTPRTESSKHRHQPR